MIIKHLHYADKVKASIPLNLATDQVNNEHYDFLVNNFIENNDPDVKIIFDGIGNMKDAKSKKIKVYEGLPISQAQILDESNSKICGRFSKNNFHVVNDIDEVTSQLKDEYLIYFTT